MNFAENLSNFDAKNPLRVSVLAEIDGLRRIYGDRFPPAVDIHDTHPFVVQFAEEVHRHLFGVTGIDKVHKNIQWCGISPAEKFPADAPYPDENEITWSTLQLVFDHLIPAEDENPDVVHLDLGNDRVLVHRDWWKSARAQTNDVVKLIKSEKPNYKTRAAML